MFHLTGIPTYLLLAELARNQVLHGRLPRPDYPAALRANAGPGWARRAELTLDHAAGHAGHGRTTACLGLVAVGAAEFAHAAAATGGRWVTNDKTLFVEGGMGEVDSMLGDLQQARSPQVLGDLVAATLRLGRRAVARAGG
ncbi:hypothetical protein ACFFOM_02800 [Microlunatus capsulatus]|uniref:Uncharacterized protein n=1 Tax=Microlunatus capsulatus TaxID=99117 RepID=A0ABS4Z2U5_9ACTN|nr:hypothetical protein [Microlunatus capsulatus]MBP2415345.1 hypothetical protein [Microlunatus capsulatus]